MFYDSLEIATISEEDKDWLERPFFGEVMGGLRSYNRDLERHLQVKMYWYYIFLPELLGALFVVM